MKAEGMIFYSSEEVHMAYNEKVVELNASIKIRIKDLDDKTKSSSDIKFTFNININIMS